MLTVCSVEKRAEEALYLAKKKETITNEVLEK